MRPILFLASLWVAVSLNLSVHGQEAGLFNEVLTLLNESGLAFDEARARRAAANALVHSADPLGDLLTEAQAIALKEYQSGRIHDSGIRLMVTNGVFYVRRMDPGSPALHAGVNVGDELRAIDDRKIIHKRFSEVIERLRADHERELKLTLAGSEGPVRDIVLTLRPVQLNTIEISEEFPSGICYIKINGLYEEGAAAMVNQLRNWEQQNKTGIILDLRDAGGRELTTVQEIAAQFAQPNSPLFTLQNISLNQAQKYESGDTRPITVPAMLLINKRTTGAAELLVATLKGSGLGAMVLGEVTQGDYGLRQYIKLAGGDFVYLATHQMTMGDGTRYDGSHGIHPDVSVADVNIKVAPISPELSFNHRESTDDEDRIGERIKERTGDDAVLQRAVDVLLGLKALNIRAIGKAP